ncbi:MAG: hypothetical protein BM564_08925 [Bacteroidetes bacterium MedPE-SWsnd-G2]|nr:MAG: hypothetical protein BM564_08925 [Bacteroidetes bacterium MedPE-SWsnd-G2]
MKPIKQIALIIALALAPVVSAQTLTPVQQKIEENKVEVFTSAERDNMQMWFANEVEKMKLTNEVEEQYLDIIIHHVVKVKRINDKDSDLAVDEQKRAFTKQIKEVNSECKEILTEEQYAMHLKNWGKLTEAAEKRFFKDKM